MADEEIESTEAAEPAEPAGSPPSTRAGQEPDWKRRKRLAEVFGDVLPDTTSDEREGDERREPSTDRWLKSQVPPHHG